MSEPSKLAGSVIATMRTIAANIEAGFTETDIPFQDLVSPAEIRLMEALLKHGLDPVQQYPIGQYHADFWFETGRLVVEVDGIQHKQRAVQDRDRDRVLWKKGIRTFRIPASYVARDADACARAVRAELDKRAIEAMES